MARVFDAGGGGVLPNKSPMGMCRWMGSHIDYNEVEISLLLEWGRTFSDFGVRQFLHFSEGLGGGLLGKTWPVP